MNQAQTPAPITRLRERYLRLGGRGVSTAQRFAECDGLASNVGELVREFVEAVKLLSIYDRRTEPFYPKGSRAANRNKRGATELFGLLEDRLIRVPELPGYAFKMVAREINPLRSPGVRLADGTPATRIGRGAGGLDYVGLVEGTLPAPVLGEIKTKGDKDAYYAFVQLLTYLSELCSRSQFERVNRFLFSGALQYPSRFDLHLMLVDPNTDSAKHAIIESTRVLATAFRTGLLERLGQVDLLGRILCLQTKAITPSKNLKLLWWA